MLRNEGDPLNTVVTCTPGPAYFGVADLEAQNMNEVPDPGATRRQHGALVRTMEEAGARVVNVAELADHPNSTFTRDAALCTPAGYVQLRMGLPARRGEPAWMAEALEGLGEASLGAIGAPGTVEGGDVALAGDVAFVGLSSRTNEEGIAQLSALLEPVGYDVRVCDVRRRYLHSGGAMSIIGPGTVLACAGVFPEGYFDGFDVIEVPNRDLAPSVANVICLGPEEVIANAAENLPTIQILEAEGIRVHRLDLSEFRKGAGGPTCLILPVERG
jgi:dimethylargininase